MTKLLCVAKPFRFVKIGTEFLTYKEVDMKVSNYTTESLEKQLDLIHELIGLVQNDRTLAQAIQDDDEMMMLVQMQARLFEEMRNRTINK